MFDSIALVVVWMVVVTISLLYLNHVRIHRRDVFNRNTSTIMGNFALMDRNFGRLRDRLNTHEANIRNLIEVGNLNQDILNGALDARFRQINERFAAMDRVHNANTKHRIDCLQRAFKENKAALKAQIAALDHGIDAVDARVSDVRGELLKSMDVEVHAARDAAYKAWEGTANKVLAIENDLYSLGITDTKPTSASSASPEEVDYFSEPVAPTTSADAEAAHSALDALDAATEAEFMDAMSKPVVPAVVIPVAYPVEIQTKYGVAFGRSVLGDWVNEGYYLRPAEDGRPGNIHFDHEGNEVSWEEATTTGAKYLEITGKGDNQVVAA